MPKRDTSDYKIQLFRFSERNQRAHSAKTTAHSGTLEHIRAYSRTFRYFVLREIGRKRTRRGTFSATTPEIYFIKEDY